MSPTVLPDLLCTDEDPRRARDRSATTTSRRSTTSRSARASWCSRSTSSEEHGSRQPGAAHGARRPGRQPDARARLGRRAPASHQGRQRDAQRAHAPRARRSAWRLLDVRADVERPTDRPGVRRRRVLLQGRLPDPVRLRGRLRVRRRSRHPSRRSTTWPRTIAVSGRHCSTACPRLSPVGSSATRQTSGWS